MGRERGRRCKGEVGGALEAGVVFLLSEEAAAASFFFLSFPPSMVELTLAKSESGSPSFLGVSVASASSLGARSCWLDSFS